MLSSSPTFRITAAKWCLRALLCLVPSATLFAGTPLTSQPTATPALLSRLDVSVRVFTEFDDNVPLVPFGRDFTGDKGGVRFGSVLSSAYRFIQDDKWQAGIGLNYIQTIHDRQPLNAYDLTLLNPRAFVGHFMSFGVVPAFASVSYDFKRDWLNGHGYDIGHTVRADLMMQPLPPLRTTFYYSALFESFDSKGERADLTSRDGTVNTFGTSVDLFLNRKGTRFITLGYSYASDAAEGSNFDSDTQSFSAGFTTKVAGPVWFTGEAHYGNADYASHTLSPAREQNIWTYRATLFCSLGEHWGIDLSYTHTSSDSSSSEFAYRRNVGGLGLTYRF
jgi:hypothetical protein